jgi:hypothetical protein
MRVPTRISSMSRDTRLPGTFCRSSGHHPPQLNIGRNTYCHFHSPAFSCLTMRIIIIILPTSDLLSNHHQSPTVGRLQLLYFYLSYLLRFLCFTSRIVSSVLQEVLCIYNGYTNFPIFIYSSKLKALVEILLQQLSHTWRQPWFFAIFNISWISSLIRLASVVLCSTD